MDYFANHAGPSSTRAITQLYGYEPLNSNRKPDCLYVASGGVGATPTSKNCSSDIMSLMGTKALFSYDLNGNLTRTDLTGTDYVGTRSTSSGFAGDGYFLTSVTNAENHNISTVVDTKEGNPLEIIDERGLLTRFEYDVFGRETERWYPDMPSDTSTDIQNHYAPRTSTAYAWEPGCPAVSCVDNEFVYTVTTLTDGAPAVTINFDRLNRNVLQLTGGFDNTVYVEQSYDAHGQLKRVTEPAYGSISVYGTDYSFDALGRVSTKTQARQTNSTSGSTPADDHLHAHRPDHRYRSGRLKHVPYLRQPGSVAIHHRR